MELRDKLYIKLKASVTFREHQVIQINCIFFKFKDMSTKSTFKYKLLYKTEIKFKIF